MQEKSESEARLHAVVHGRVQGVNFRYYTIRAAERLDITGWVANRRDGAVETIAEGQREALDEFLAFLHHGSPSSIVHRVDVTWQDCTGEFREFGVRYL